MTAQVIVDGLRPVEAIDALVARHGFLRVLLALPMVALKRRRAKVLLAGDLSPHLMRDIGLGSGVRSGKSWELG